MKLSSLFLMNLILTSYFISNIVQGANILFYFAVSGSSHRTTVWPVIEKLANSGHKVTFLTGYPSKNLQQHPNITDYVISNVTSLDLPENLAKDLGTIDVDWIGRRVSGGVSATDNVWNITYKLGLMMCSALMHNQGFLNWVNKASFDLVIINAVFNDCGYGLVHKFKAKHIIFSTTSHMMWNKEAFGLPDENHPEIQFHPPINMTFLQAVENELVSLFWQWRRLTESFPQIEDMLKEGLQISDLPHLDEIERNTSIIFTYTHPAEEYARSLPPNFIEIGGIHCNDERKPLPPDLQDYINSAGDHGIVLLSFGSFAELSNLPISLQDIFFGAISQVPNVKFIVKYKGDYQKELPHNVKTAEWLPQQDLLANSKMRAFIGHGGLLGTQEAIYHGVPMIVIPLFAEQDFQATKAQGRETAIALEISELTEEKLLHAILQILNNKKYKDNTIKLSKFFKDRPVKPLDTAVWWIEYVLRHDDISHLRSVGLTLKRTWYERRMLHIWGFLFGCAVFALLIVVIVGYLISRCYYYVTKISETKLKSE